MLSIDHCKWIQRDTCEYRLDHFHCSSNGTYYS